MKYVIIGIVAFCLSLLVNILFHMTGVEAFIVDVIIGVIVGVGGTGILLAINGDL